jgi:hypothetical protein
MCSCNADTGMDNYTITLRPSVDEPDADTITVHNLKIKPGGYTATFSMQGCTEEGYLAVRWRGVVNHYDSNSDSRTVAVIFGSEVLEKYTGKLYLQNPGDSLSVTFYDNTNELITTLKPIVQVHLEKTS